LAVDTDSASEEVLAVDMDSVSEEVLAVDMEVEADTTVKRFIF
jgi:hypothetical protein